MAHQHPAHNLGEVITPARRCIKQPDLSSEDLIEYIPAPDFPTGALILGRSGARKGPPISRGAAASSRAKTHVEEVRKDRYAIVVDEIPYQVNKASMIERIADSGAREEAGRDFRRRRTNPTGVGVRVVIELKARRDARGRAEPAFSVSRRCKPRLAATCWR